MTSKFDIANAFVQYGVLSPTHWSFPFRSRKNTDFAITAGMQKINCNLLILNVPLTATNHYGVVDVTPEIIYETLQEFGHTTEVMRICTYVYAARVSSEDISDIVKGLDGNKIGSNTLKVLQYNDPILYEMPHECIKIHFPNYVESVVQQGVVQQGVVQQGVVQQGVVQQGSMFYWIVFTLLFVIAILSILFS